VLSDPGFRRAVWLKDLRRDQRKSDRLPGWLVMNISLLRFFALFVLPVAFPRLLLPSAISWCKRTRRRVLVGCAPNKLTAPSDHRVVCVGTSTHAAYAACDVVDWPLYNAVPGSAAKFTRDKTRVSVARRCERKWRASYRCYSRQALRSRTFNIRQ